MTYRFCLIFVFACFSVSGVKTAVAESQSWTPAILDSQAYLADYSYAGYEWGEKPLPDLTPTLDVTEFGAIPNDNKDDTDAMRAAIKAAESQKGMAVLHIPAGKFIVNDVLYIERSNFVLQGEGSGPDGTVIEVSRPLRDMHVPWSTKWLKAYYFLFGKRARGGKLFSAFSWTGGVFWIRAPHKAHPKDLDVQIVDGTQAQHIIHVSNTTGLHAGDVVTIQWFNHEGKRGSLLKEIYGDYNLAMGRRLYGWFWNPVLTQPVTIVRVEKNQLVIKEPLLHDVRAQWTPKLVRPTYLKQVGIENLRIEFPRTQYAGHHLEEGYNGIYFTDTMHSWIRNVSIHNSDSAILSHGCKNITLDKITVTGRPGHYTIMTSKSYGALVTRFNLLADSIHNPSFNTKTRLSVYSHGVIEKAHLDQHRGINHQNLFDDIEINHAENLFAHGGAAYWGPTAGRFNTFWNIRIKNTPANGFIGQCREAPEARLIGIVGLDSEVNFDYQPAPYVEGLNKKGISIPSLYQYQLQKRLNGGR
jgi:hypothetical protein